MYPIIISNFIKWQVTVKHDSSPTPPLYLSSVCEPLLVFYGCRTPQGIVFDPIVFMSLIFCHPTRLCQSRIDIQDKKNR